MAYVYIYPKHRSVLDGLITSSKVSSQLGAIATGPFKDQRDAYVFAASIGLALGTPTPETSMPKSKTDSISIKDSVFLGAAGATELSLVAPLLRGLSDDDDTENALRMQLKAVADRDDTARFALLDRYAYAGFCWLDDSANDTATVRELVMEAIDKIIATDIDVNDLIIDDPLTGFLL